MTFAELKAELAARGFDYLPDARLGQYIAWAAYDLDDMHLWPYRTVTVTGTSSVSIPDLGVIESVVDVVNGNNPLPVWDRRDLQDDYNDLSITGTPMAVYVENGAVVRSFPVGGTIRVRYYAVPAEVGTGVDPASPERFHRLIVDLAVERAYRDSDNHQSAEQLRVSIERDLDTMRRALLFPHVTGSQTQIQVGNGFWT